MATAPNTPAMSARRSSVPTSVRGFVLDEEEAAKIPIPSAFPAPPHVEATPLPWLSLSVLAITVMGEFLCANVSTPFLLFMVRGFGVGEDEAEVGYWTGILVSVFFLTQFATSLIWASLADNFGRRNILFISLLGSSVTCTVFGTQKTFQYALGVRLVQGVFAGAIGVARSAVGSITDSSNEGRAYAIMGFAWGLGGVIGAVIGGTFESPAQKWPALFDRFGFLKTHPYLLPCAMAASVTLAGAVMCLLLDRDARPRQFETPSDTDTDTSITIPTSSSPFLSPSKGVPLPARVEILSRDDSVAGTRPFGIPIPARVDSPRGQTAISFAPEQRIGSSLSGSPMMGGGRRRSSAASRMGMNTLLANRMWTHRRSSAAQPEAPEMNFAERLIAANENQVTSMAQLWVDAAIRTDVPYSEQVEENALEFDSDDDMDTPDIRHGSRVLTGPRPSIASERTPLLFRPSREQLSPGTPQRPPVHRSDSSSTVIYPAIFANPGVEAPAEEVVLQPVLLPGGIEAIQEERQSMASDEDLEMQMEPTVVQQSALKQIPALVVLQYGLLALHTTTHDQVFYSYLMSRYEAGGLGLSAVHFSQLIAIMSVAQVIYQFYLYPNIGPPRGSFSHLSMFRLGSLLFIPSYATVVMYRGWPEGWVMPGLIASTAVRFCGNTFAFTSITILLNYMTPPSAVGLANGLAQSIASLARFIGPALGAKLWEQSVKYDPSGYAFGFWVCSVVCGGALLASWMIR